MQAGERDAALWVEEAVGVIGDREVVEGWVARLPPGYRDRTSPAEFAEDLGAAVALGDGRAAPRRHDGGAPEQVLGADHNLRLRAAEPGDPASFRLRRAGLQAVELTAVLPVLESFGLAVTEAVPHHVTAPPGVGPDVHFDDFGLRPTAVGLGFAVDAGGARLVEAIGAAGSGAADVDGLNRLVVLAGLDWRQVVLLRAYRRFRRQAGVHWRDAQLDGALAAHPLVAAALVAYVEARLAGPAPGGDPTRQARAADARTTLEGALGATTSLDEDQILRGYLHLADATVRTNWYAGRPDTLVAKFDSSLIPELPRPRPHVETFVHGPDVEGVHLRMGPIARGGIRWSDRPDDLRTEVLGLAAAQTKKNAIIVPTGAKGGFVARGGAATAPERVLHAYRRYITGLLEVTDNVVADEVVHPPSVVATDGDDPYLVVAADKGTATYSDDANALSAERGFWLGDAFASGGSRGYDHKAMGITARGAWVAVRRHFRQLGIDVQREPITVAGVGDMSGDVFGNGMLLSRAIELVAAFDHRHVFVDPSPDAGRSWIAREALAARGRSSWDDYERSAISAGGGVWSRAAKEIDLPREARAALGLPEGVLRPPEVVAAILTAPVDLLWFGGIGTFVKDAAESDAQVGDHANDLVRVTADRVRARVVAEGGNLGMTQRARIRYSRRGGRVNADFIDNAAGVATSDREVNLKILLGVAELDGRLGAGERDRLLVASTDEVAEAVLTQVDHSVAALDRAVPDSAAQLDAYIALLGHLERTGLVDREVEALPDDAELATRRAAGAGLIRPELAGLLAFAKSDLVRALVRSPLVDDPAFEDAVAPYFPSPVRAVAGDLVARHRLYPQLVATDVAGELVDHVGPVWAHETATELGRAADEVVAAYWAARQVTGAGAYWAEVERAAALPDGAGLDADLEAAAHAGGVAAVTGLARQYLRRPGRVDLSALVTTDGGADRAGEAGGVADPGAHWPSASGGAMARALDQALDRMIVAATAAADVAPVVRASGCRPARAVAALAAVDTLPALSSARRLLTSGERRRGRWASWQARALEDDLGDLRRSWATWLVAQGEDPATALARWGQGPGATILERADALLAAGAAVPPGSPDAAVACGMVLRILSDPPV